jgi:hypothetical protein
VCPDRPFSKDRLEALLVELVKNIENPAAAMEFQKIVLKSL